ncbi:MAG: hypothetical protein ACT4NY_31575 [Pseudonocardiales bacterium]
MESQDQPVVHPDDLDVAADVPCLDSSCTYEGEPDKNSHLDTSSD